jgi:hypothetical protein
MKPYTYQAAIILLVTLVIAGVLDIQGYNRLVLSGLLIVPVLFWVWKWNDEHNKIKKRDAP